jgi:hypothetical protein
MTKKTRTFLFVLCVLAFFVVSPTIILYTQGYRLDSNNWKLTKTGAFYFKVLPKSVDIFVNNKLAKKTDFFFGSTLVENLLPGKYPVEIKKDGYLPWKKNLEAREMNVTEAKAIILFPEKIDFQLAGKGIDNFFPSPSDRTTMLVKKDSQGWYLTVFDFDNNAEKILAKQSDLLKKGVITFLDARWSSDSRKLVIQTEVTEKKRYFLLDTETKNGPANLDSLGDFEKLDFDPQNSQKFLVLKNETLSSGNFSLPSQSLVKVTSSVLDFASLEGKLYLLDKDGFVSRINNLASPDSQRINEVPLSIKPETFYAIKTFPRTLFLQEQNSVYYFNEKTKAFNKIIDNADGFELSPDNEKAVYYNNGEVWVYFLKENSEQPARQPGEKFLLARFSEKINQVFWLNNNYLIFSVGNSIKISETDNRDQPNLVNLAEFKNPKIFFSQDNKKASVLTEGNLFVSENLLPY